MNAIYRSACDELEELDRKAEKNGNMSLQDFQYADMLSHLKKTMLINHEMDKANDGYSGLYWDGYRNDGSYAGRRNVRRYTGYSGHQSRQETMDHLRMAIESAPDEETRRVLEATMSNMERG